MGKLFIGGFAYDAIQLTERIYKIKNDHYTFWLGVVQPNGSIIPMKKIYAKRWMDDNASSKCRRCRGRGFILSFNHNNGGKCFDCNGTGKVRPLVNIRG